MKNRLRVIAIAALVVAGGSVSSTEAQSAAVKGAAPGPLALAEALKEFQQRLDSYVELRRDVSRKLQLAPLSPTPSAAELSGRQDALARAIIAARQGAKPGNLVSPAVAGHIIRIVTADAQRRQSAAETAALSEVPRAPRPNVNNIYPADAALPTVPPLLLSELPRLPDNLQYRFFGRHVTIIDADVQVIIDYVANALPPH
jgi:hypothetical protein